MLAFLSLFFEILFGGVRHTDEMRSILEVGSEQLPSFRVFAICFPRFTYIFIRISCTATIHAGIISSHIERNQPADLR